MAANDDTDDGTETDPSVVRERRIVDVLMALQEGEVTTYGDVAAVAGYPKQSRLVGRILRTTDHEVPWWRVVNAAGRLVPGHEAEQIALLKGTLGKCLLQQSELQQSAAGLTKSVTSMQQELTKLVAQEVVDLSPEITKAHLEPGEAPQCRCKRLRR